MTALDYLTPPTVIAPSGRPEYLVPEDALPWQHFVSGTGTPDHAVGALGGGPGFTNNSWYFSSIHWNNAANAELGYDIYLAAGTWRMEWFRDTRGDYPIVRYSRAFVGDLSGDLDLYAAARTRVVHRVEGIVVGSTGWNRFISKVVGKNAASTGYVHVFSGLALTRTA